MYFCVSWIYAERLGGVSRLVCTGIQLLLSFPAAIEEVRKHTLSLFNHLPPFPPLFLWPLLATVRADGMRFIQHLAASTPAWGHVPCRLPLFLFLLPFLPAIFHSLASPSGPEVCLLLSFPLSPAALFHRSSLGPHSSLTCTRDHFTPHLCLFCLSCHPIAPPSPSQISQITQLAMREHPARPAHTTTTSTIPTDPQLISADRGRWGRDRLWNEDCWLPPLPVIHLRLFLIRPK